MYISFPLLFSPKKQGPWCQWRHWQRGNQQVSNDDDMWMNIDDAWTDNECYLNLCTNQVDYVVYIVPNPLSTCCGFLTCQTLYKTPLSPPKYPNLWKGYRFARGKGEGRCETTCRLPVPILLSMAGFGGFHPESCCAGAPRHVTHTIQILLHISILQFRLKPREYLKTQQMIFKIVFVELYHKCLSLLPLFNQVQLLMP